MHENDNPDFYNTWHDREYFEDYLAVQEDETPVLYDAQGDAIPTRKPRIGFGAHLYDMQGRMKEGDTHDTKPQRSKNR